MPELPGSCNEVEQPASSVLKSTPWMMHLLSCGPSYIAKTWLGLYGHWAPKPTQLFGSL